MGEAGRERIGLTPGQAVDWNAVEITNNGGRNGRGSLQLGLPVSARAEDDTWVDVAEATIEFASEEPGLE